MAKCLFCGEPMEEWEKSNQFPSSATIHKKCEAAADTVMKKTLQEGIDLGMIQIVGTDEHGNPMYKFIDKTNPNADDQVPPN